MFYQKKETKDIQKCVRMTKEIYEFVDKQDGKGFNQKFENLIKKYEINEEELLKTIEFYQSQINDLQKYYQDTLLSLRTKISRVSMYMDYIDDIVFEDMPHL